MTNNWTLTDQAAAILKSYGCNDVEAARAVVALVRADMVRPQVKPLVWHRSRMPSWNDDWHTVPTGYTIRCADEWGWKWSSPLGAHGHERSPEAAKAAAQADHEARVLAALDLTPDPRIAALVEAAEPLAAMAERYDPPDGDDDLECWSGLAVPKIKHIRALRAALAAMKCGEA